MENKKITELIEKAASDITLLEFSDPKEVKQLQQTISEIDKSLDELHDSPAELLKSARSANEQALAEIENLLKKDADDSDRSIQIISASIQLIQELSNNFGKETDESAEENTQGFIIPEEDIPLIQDFITESNEHLENAEAALLELENAPKDNETLNLIFRAFHTIKGMAGFMNLNDINALAHSAENLLDMARKDQLTITGENSDLVFESLDVIKKMIQELTACMESSQPVVAPDNLPDLLARLKAAAEGEPQDAKKEPQTKTESDKKEKSETPVERRSGEDRRSGSDRRAVPADEKIKVNTSKLDDLINMAGELVIAQLMVAEEVKNNLSHEHELNRKIAHQNKIVRELQELSMAMRMVPIQGVFQKMARLSRDLSRKADKTIDFVTTGEETELDRSIVDKISDPLVHMVRNSIDHGIESPEERKKAGKTEKGTLHLRAFHKAGNIVIEIADDGKGLDRSKILKKAIDNGLVEPNQELSDEEVYKLVFHPGLSTAKKITDISGRGVGMDVVKKNIEALRGRIDITSEPNKGTTFTISLPLTLAVIDGQIVRIGNEKYIIPINTIDQSIRPTKEQLSTVQNQGEIVHVRGQLIPLVRLYQLFNTSPDTEEPSQSSIVIVENDNRKCCLLVDELLGQQQVVIKSLGETLGKINGISGGAIMGDGKVSLILDIPGLIKLSQM